MRPYMNMSVNMIGKLKTLEKIVTRISMN